MNAKRSGKPAKTFSKEAIKALTEYDWPGNVRELQNLVERCFTISRDSVIQLQDISILSVAKPKIKGLSLKDAVDAFEQEYIGDVLESVDGTDPGRSHSRVHRNTLLSQIGGIRSKKIGRTGGGDQGVEGLGPIQRRSSRAGEKTSMISEGEAPHFPP